MKEKRRATCKSIESVREAVSKEKVGNKGRLRHDSYTMKSPGGDSMD